MPGSSVYGIFQAGTLEQVAISFSRGSSWPRNQNYISCVSWIGRWILYYCATCCYSVTKLWLTLCQPMNGSMPGFPALHYLLEFVQIHVHWVGDTIQSSHPLSSPSPPAFSLSHHQGLFQWVGSVHQAKVLVLHWFPLGWTSLISLQSKSVLQHHSSKASILWHSAFFMVQLSHPYLTIGKT